MARLPDPQLPASMVALQDEARWVRNLARALARAAARLEASILALDARNHPRNQRARLARARKGH